VTAYLRLDKNTNEVKFVKAIVDSDEALVNPVVADLNDYDTIAFSSSAWDVMNEDGSFNQNFTTGSVIMGYEADAKTAEFKTQDNFEDGYDYYCVFRIYDVYGNRSYSNFVKLN